MTNFILIETTLPNLRLAKNLGKVLLEEKLAACVQFCEVKSSYLWMNKIENSREILLKIKTKKSLYFEVEKTIKKHHPYEIPQIFSVQIETGSRPYFDWIEKSTKKSSK
jgi:periplasmic divalent cation tolerance protein